MKTMLLLIALFLPVVAGCATAVDCIHANGYLSDGSFILDQNEIVRNNEIQYRVTINCNGSYQFWVVFTPAERFKIGVTEEGENRYYEAILLEDGSIERKYLDPQDINLVLKVKSLDEVNEELVVERHITLPPYQYGISPISIKLPKMFKAGETLLFSISISGKNSFYDQYKWLDASLRSKAH